MSSDLDLIYGTQAKPSPPSDDGKDTHDQAPTPQEHTTPVPVKSSTPKPKKAKALPPSDTTIPRHHDTMQPRNHDTTIPQEEHEMLEVVRKAVKQVGKEAATYRFTVEEKNQLEDIKYTYKRRKILTSENELTRIAINYFIEDYRQHGEESLLAKILKRLNS
jgi:hypothetical protein